MRRVIRSLALASALGLSASTSFAADDGVAPASTDDPVRAKVLFDQAVELASSGDFKTACDKLEQSLALHDGLGTSFHLAGCWQKIGRTASAYALFAKVAKRAHEQGQTEREQLARARLDALGLKLSRLRIDVLHPAPQTEVRRDDQLVEETSFGQPLPVDRGEHEIRVSAPGKETWSTKVDITEPATTVAVQVPVLADAPKAPPAAAPEAPPPPKPAEPRPPARTSPAPEPAPVGNGSTQRTLALVVGGLGVVGLGVGVLEGAQYLHSNREAKGICPSGVNCSSEEIAQHGQSVDNARHSRTWSYVGLGVGAAAVGVGTYLYFTAPRGSRSAERASAFRVEPLVDGQGTWGGAVRAAF